MRLKLVWAKMREMEADALQASSSPPTFLASEMMQLSSSRLLSDGLSDDDVQHMCLARDSHIRDQLDQKYGVDDVSLVPLVPWTQHQHQGVDGEQKEKIPTTIMVQEGVGSSQHDGELMNRVVDIGNLLVSNSSAGTVTQERQYDHQVNVFSLESPFTPSNMTVSLLGYDDEEGETKEEECPEVGDDVDRYFGRWRMDNESGAKRRREELERAGTVLHSASKTGREEPTFHLDRLLPNAMRDSVTVSDDDNGFSAERNGAQSKKLVILSDIRKPRRRNTVFQWEKLVDLPQASESRRQSSWPFWLHPAFRIESDGHHERVSVAHLHNLFRTVSVGPRSFLTYRSIFESIFGPLVCYNRLEEMYETIRAIGLLQKNTSLMNEELAPAHRHLHLPLNSLSVEDLYVPRYLGSFPSFSAFREHDKALKATLPHELYSVFNERLIGWYGGAAEVEDYQLWGVARILMMESYNDRPLKVSDLSREDQADWQQRLDQCASLEDAITATEEYFGPLEQVDHHKRPKIDVRKVWSPCQCSICLRSQKRPRYSK